MPHKTRIIEDNLHLGAKGKRFADAKFNRKEQTEVERFLWKNIRNRKLNDLKFRRQHPILQFIADFYCHEAKLVVEIDGGYHNDSEQLEKDKARTEELERFGISVIRFSNEEVISDIDGVLTRITDFLLKKK